jgi:hypothetical protein
MQICGKLAGQRANTVTIEQLANIAEVLGMLLVAITLIFLTVQVRENTKALKSSAASSAHEKEHKSDCPHLSSKDSQEQGVGIQANGAGTVYTLAGEF